MGRSFSDFKKYIKDKKVAVLGIGVSNKPLIRCIVSLGARVTACDMKTIEKLGSECSEFEGMGVKLRCGEDYLAGLEKFDVIFKTPMLRPDIPELLLAKDNGVYITSEMEEFVKYCPAPIIGVTGSDGKTTTTTLIYHMLTEEGYKVWLGGNIGTPLFDKLDDITEKDKVILELSSFQLMVMDVSPQRVVITNLSPNHLDVHKSMEEYVEAKKNIFKFQEQDGLLILNLDNEITRNMAAQAKGKVSFFSRLDNVDEGACIIGKELVLITKGIQHTICSIEEVKLPGSHNIENLLAASAAVTGLCSVESMRKVAVTFMGVEHRIEFVREINGVKYYNDSIASSPTRAAAGLNSFKQKVILIAGGYDKKIPFDELAEVGVHRIRLLILVGVTARKIEDAFNKEMEKTGIKLPIIYADSLASAVDAARKNSSPGDIVTLSPACASFDMFTNFEERGNKFKEIVNNI